MTTTKTELAKRIAKREVCSMSEATFQVEMVCKEIRDALKNGEKVRISGLGIFYPKHYEEHIGYDPFGCKKILVPSYKTVTFKIARDFMNELNAVER